MPTNLGLLHRKSKKKKRLIDSIVYLTALLGPGTVIPQIYTVWLRESTGVSLLTWGGMIFYQAIWIWYGIEHKEKPLIIINTLWIIVEVLVVLGVLLG